MTRDLLKLLLIENQIECEQDTLISGCLVLYNGLFYRFQIREFYGKVLWNQHEREVFDEPAGITTYYSRSLSI